MRVRFLLCNNQSMTKTELETRECWACDGAGQVRDMTNQDKVYVRPGASLCSECRGTGVTQHRTHVVDVFAHVASDKIGDMPDWMC